MRRVLVLAVLALAGCGGAGESGGEATTPLIAIHLTSSEERSGYERVEFEGRVLFVGEEPFVADDDIAMADAARSGDAVMLNLEFTPDAAERLRAYTADNIGRAVVLRFDSRIIMAPVIRGAMGGNAQVAVPVASGLEPNEVVERVHARWPPRAGPEASLPDSIRAELVEMGAADQEARAGFTAERAQDTLSRGE